MRSSKFKWLDFLCFCLFFLALIFFCYTIATAFPHKGYFDFPIFVDTGFDFAKSGKVYLDESGYAPNLAVYKFPPLLAALLVHGVRLGVSYEGFFTVAFWGHVLAYLGSVALIVGLAVFLGRISCRLGMVLFSLGLLLCPLLDTNLLRLQLDVYVLLLVSAALYCLLSNKNFLSGLFIGLAAALKIYPAVLLGSFCVLGAWEAIAGAAVGFVAATLYCAAILGVDETLHFFSVVLPVLLDELPAGGGAGNISFPTLFHNMIFPYYSFSYTQSLLVDYWAEQLDAGKISIDVLLEKSRELAVFVKAATSVFFLGLLFLSFKIRQHAGADCYAAVYSAFVFFMITFMQNSWLNYQVVLVAPILVVFACLFREGDKHGTLLWLAVLSFVALWCSAVLDALQERANHYAPPEVVPSWIRDVVAHVSGLSSLGGIVRCMAALVLMFICLSLGFKRISFVIARR